ncbi:MAG TPA: M20/M25/M40 family metallo-hydrolase [Bryobacteraceae bacterium]|nr:M20/M25/M40 family metallo-hydrolase [Bryobacteraceae bacterium]
MSNFRFVVLALATATLAIAAEPNWPQVEDHAVAFLQQYVRIPTINPPADTVQSAKLIQSELAAAGIEATLYRSGPKGQTNLIARLPGRDHSKRPLLLLNHMDVVPVDASRWKENPFGAEIKNGELWGRGSLDMKSTGVMQLTALILLKRLGIVPPRDIVFVSTCDEETGGVLGAQWMIEHHWDEMNPEYVMDEGGVGSRDVYAPGKLVFGVAVGDKQVLWLRLRATGIAGHGSQPNPDNANDILLRAIEQARAFPPSTKPNPIVTEMHDALGTFATNKFMNAIQQNTMSVTSLRSGVGDPPKANVIPSAAEATLDCRLLPGQNAAEFISEIKARINDRRVTVEQISRDPDDPKLSSKNTPLYEAITKSIRARSPEALVMPIVVPFGTDASKFRVRGVNSYGIMPMIIDTQTLATMHSDSEHIPLDQFKRGLHIYFDVLRSDW